MNISQYNQQFIEHTTIFVNFTSILNTILSLI